MSQTEFPANDTCAIDLVQQMATSGTIEELGMSLPCGAASHYLKAFYEIQQHVITFCGVRDTQLQLLRHLSRGSFLAAVVHAIQAPNIAVCREFHSSASYNDMERSMMAHLHAARLQALASLVNLKQAETLHVKALFNHEALSARNKMCLPESKALLSAE